MRCVTHIPSASTPWLAAKAATVPGGAPLGPPPHCATGTMGSAGEPRGINLLGPIMGREGVLCTHQSPFIPVSHRSKDGTVLTSGWSSPSWMGCGVWGNWAPQAQGSLAEPGQAVGGHKPPSHALQHCSWGVPYGRMIKFSFLLLCHCVVSTYPLVFKFGLQVFILG